MRRFTLAFAFLMLSSLLNCKDPVEENCRLACKRFTQCTQEKMGALPEIIVKEADLNCNKTCTMVQGELLSCYEQENDSCDGFSECVIQSGALE